MMTDQIKKNEGHGESQAPDSTKPTSRNYEVLKPLLDEIRMEMPAINALQGLKNIRMIQPDTTSPIAEIVDRANLSTALMKAWDAPAQDVLARLALNVKMPEIPFPDLDLSKLLVLQSDGAREAATRALEGINATGNLKEILAARMSDLFKANLVIQNPLKDYAHNLREVLGLQNAEFRTHLASVMDSRNLLENVFQSLNPAVEVMRQMAAEQNASITRAMEPVRQYFRHEEETAEAFLYAGFCMAPSMSSALIQRVVALRRENKKKRIAETIMRYYQSRSYAHLKEMVVKWETNPLFAPHMEIIRDALDAHLNRKYTLSIPILLIHAEGIVGDFALYHKIPTKLTNKQVFADALEDVPANRMRYATHKSVTTFVSTTLYANKKFETLPLRSNVRINRHVILHGRQVNYGTERNSLRVFLLLDALSALTIELHDDTMPRTKRRAPKSKPK